MQCGGLTLQTTLVLVKSLIKACWAARTIPTREVPTTGLTLMIRAAMGHIIARPTLLIRVAVAQAAGRAAAVLRATKIRMSNPTLCLGRGPEISPVVKAENEAGASFRETAKSLGPINNAKAAALYRQALVDYYASLDAILGGSRAKRLKETFRALQ